MLNSVEAVFVRKENDLLINSEVDHANGRNAEISKNFYLPALKMLYPFTTHKKPVHPL
jgi:hypothetical protein